MSADSRNREKFAPLCLTQSSQIFPCVFPANHQIVFEFVFEIFYLKSYDDDMIT